LKSVQSHYKYCRRFKQSMEKFRLSDLNFKPANYFEDHPNHVFYQCPICFKNSILFTNTQAFATSEFNLDHYPPRSAGGWKKGFACKVCNSKSGTDFEDELKDQLHHNSYVLKFPNSIINITATIKEVPGGPYKGRMTMQQDGIGMVDLGTLAKTPHVAKWSDDVKKDPTNFEFNVSGFFPSTAKVKKALIKAAYWYCFARWGYQFSKSIGGSVMRKYINGESDYPIERAEMYWLEDENVERMQEGISFISAPNELLSFTVNIPMKLKETGYRCVVGVPIPNPTENCWEDINKLFVDNHDRQLQFTHIDHKFARGVRDYDDEWKRILNGDVTIYPVGTDIIP
jgi:hypothetical protein